MIKKILALFLIFLSACFAQEKLILETDRTIFIPWTIEHTQEWEIIESNDTTPSHFRRNEFFEDKDLLILRDTNWLRFMEYMQSYCNKTIAIPPLGFAILDKKDKQLIGTIILKIHNDPQVLSFSYALIPQVRHQRLGQEIINAFIMFINTIMESHIFILKEDYTKAMFMSAWQKEGIQQEPDFNYLASFFNTDSSCLKKIVAYVDILNPASLKTLINNHFQATEIIYTDYTFLDEHRFTLDVFLEYQPNCLMQSHLDPYISAILSRDQDRIDETFSYLKNYFQISDTYQYLKVPRLVKANLKPLSKIVKSTSDLRDDIKRNNFNQSYYSLLDCID